MNLSFIILKLMLLIVQCIIQCIISSTYKIHTYFILLTSEYFDKNLPITITCNATKLGFRVMLEQLHGTISHPIAFASRWPTAAEQNYS